METNNEALVTGRVLLWDSLPGLEGGICMVMDIDRKVGLTKIRWEDGSESWRPMTSQHYRVVA